MFVSADVQNQGDIEQGTREVTPPAPSIEMPSTVYSGRTYTVLKDISKLTMLCVEVGSTRIKAGLIDHIASIDALRQVRTYATESQPYRKDIPLPSLFKRGEVLTVLSPQVLEREGVSPDVIQPLGARIAMRDYLPHSLILPYEEVLKKQQAWREGKYPPKYEDHV